MDGNPRNPKGGGWGRPPPPHTPPSWRVGEICPHKAFPYFWGFRFFLYREVCLRHWLHTRTNVWDTVFTLEPMSVDTRLYFVVPCRFFFANDEWPGYYRLHKWAAPTPPHLPNFWPVLRQPPHLGQLLQPIRLCLGTQNFFEFLLNGTMSGFMSGRGLFIQVAKTNLLGGALH